MKIRKIICLVLLILALATTSIVSVSAATYSENDGKRVINITEEDLFNSIWEYELYVTVPDEELETGETVVASIMHYELKEFLNDYEPVNNDVTVSDVSHEFNDWFNEKYTQAGTVLEKDEYNKYYEYNTDNPDEKFYYSYDETTDRYICKDADGKIVKTYAKYHYEVENQTSSETDSNNSSAEQSNSSVHNDSQSSGSGTGSTAEAVAVEAITEQPTETQIESNNSMSSIQVVILIVLGTLLVIGVIVLVVMPIRRKGRVK